MNEVRIKVSCLWDTHSVVIIRAWYEEQNCLSRCVPGSSVLTPDNRAWLDSQGHKSPEISRKRIIIGQQSFTFSRDGDLIESQSPPSSFTDSDR